MTVSVKHGYLSPIWSRLIWLARILTVGMRGGVHPLRGGSYVNILLISPFRALSSVQSQKSTTQPCHVNNRLPSEHGSIQYQLQGEENSSQKTGGRFKVLLGV